jgi:uncharacterized protein YPO0396
MEFTKHFKNMLEERSIRQQWVERAIHEPEEVEEHEDGTRHFLRRMEEHGNRWLRVVINIQAQPHRAVQHFLTEG